MHIKDLLRLYAQARDIERGTLKWLSLIVDRYSRHLGRIAELSDFNDDSVNAWTASMIEGGCLSRRTVQSYRRGLAILWRFAIEERLISAPPLRLRKIKAPKLIPTAWTPEQVAALLSQARSLTGYYRCGVSRAAFWSAVVLTIWDTGLRIGDILRLDREHVSPDGVGCIIQKKTGWPLVFRLSPQATMTLLTIVAEDRRSVFGGVISRKTVFKTFRRIAAAAGLSGGTKKIRKSGATAVERETPGAAMGYLGHKTPGMAYQFYVDPRLIQDSRPMPPPLPT